MDFFTSIFTGVGNFFAQIPMKVVLAFLVGALGSGAYITALYFKFIGDSDGNRDIIIKPFRKRYSTDISVNKCVWYSVVGGSIAVVFQVDVPNFVAVQSLILGATWPAIVSQFLSGRMSAPSKQEQEELDKFLSSEKPRPRRDIDIAEILKTLEGKVKTKK
jgi:hypothetical protein